MPSASYYKQKFLDTNERSMTNITIKIISKKIFFSEYTITIKERFETDMFEVS